MRDVTDNVTVDLPGMEQKRGRGRPRKAHAMTNAERQAAYRARRRAQQPADRSVTVTKMPVEVDAYDECRLEVERLRAELVALRLKAERHEVERNNVFALADLKEDQRQEALAEAEGLRIQLSKALGEVQRLNSKKSVTPSNGNPVSFAAMVDLLSQAAKARSKSALLDIREGISWKDGVVGNTKVTDNQLAQLIAAMTGGRRNT
ncbi:hypothetical protein [Ralstonia pseudosolanacearum]|uniref:hypothetical protein n=1 Tax=Ralstonia pseudosolanacearum TaxID=1310165 RepID=UPI0020039709|nr:MULTISPECIES: hypothetical protein [Ralstonia]UZF23510.1 hypothetical protein LGV80_10075 [Ralstonia sp. RS642]